MYPSNNTYFKTSFRSGFTNTLSTNTFLFSSFASDPMIICCFPGILAVVNASVSQDILLYFRTASNPNCALSKPSKFASDLFRAVPYIRPGTLFPLLTSAFAQPIHLKNKIVIFNQKQII